MLMWVIWCKQLRRIHLLVVHACLYIQNRLERPEMFCEHSSPVTEAADGRWKVLLGLMVKCSCLEVPGC